MRSNYFYTTKINWKTPEEKEKLVRLCETYYSDMYHIAYSILSHPEMVKDAVQDSCIKLMYHLDDVQEQNTVRTRNFIQKIARNTALTMLKRSQRELLCEPVTMETQLPKNLDTPESQAVAEDLKNQLRHFIGDLKQPERECIDLYYFHDLSVTEIADILEISKAAVQKRLQRGRAKLKKRPEREELY